PRRADQAGSAHCRRHRRASVSGARPHARRGGGPGRRSDNAQCADAQGGRGRRRDRDLSHRGTPVLKDARSYYYATSYGVGADSSDYLKSVRIKTGRGTVVGRALLEGRIVQLADVLADPEYTWTEGQGRAGFRTVLGGSAVRREQSRR